MRGIPVSPPSSTNRPFAACCFRRHSVVVFGGTAPSDNGPNPAGADDSISLAILNSGLDIDNHEIFHTFLPFLHLQQNSLSTRPRKLFPRGLQAADRDWICFVVTWRDVASKELHA